MQVNALKMNNLSHNWGECAVFLRLWTVLIETVQRSHKGRPLASLSIMRLGGCSSIRQRRI